MHICTAALLLVNGKETLSVCKLVTGSHTEQFWVSQLPGPVLCTQMAEINSEEHTKAAATLEHRVS